MSDKNVEKALDNLLTTLGQSNITLGYGGRSDAAYHGRHIQVQWRIKPLSMTEEKDKIQLRCSTCGKTAKSCKCEQGLSK